MRFARFHSHLATAFLSLSKKLAFNENAADWLKPERIQFILASKDEPIPLSETNLFLTQFGEKMPSLKVLDDDHGFNQDPAGLFESVLESLA